MTVLNIMLSREDGGIQTSALQYHDALAQSGWDPMSLLDPRAVVLPKFSGRQTLTFQHRGPWDLLACWSLRRLVARLKVKGIIAHGARAVRLSRWSGVPVIAVCHNYHFRSLRLADYWIAITDHMKRSAVELGYWSSERMAVIPHPMRLQERPRPYRHRQGSPLILGCLGRMVPKKGMDVLLEALALLMRHHPSVLWGCHIAGSGPERAMLQDKAVRLGVASQVVWHDWIQDVGSWMEGCDILVCPSRHEPFGLVILEAMARGIPVIASNIEGPLEIVSPGPCGLLVEPDRPDLLASALVLACHDPERMARLGQAGWERVRDHYHPDWFAKRLNGMLRDILSKPRNHL